MSLRISNHAKEQLVKREISEQEVLDVFSGKNKAKFSRPSDKDSDCVELFAVIRERLCKIVYSVTTETVATAYFLRGEKWKQI